MKSCWYLLHAATLASVSLSSALPLIESFHTFVGEGQNIHAEKAGARLGGENVGLDAPPQVRPRRLHGEDVIQIGVQSLSLIDDDTGQDLITLFNGTVVNKETLNIDTFEIRANIHGNSDDSVVFVLDGAAFTDNTKSYSWSNLDLGVGAHTMTATAYMLNNGGGTALGAITVTFTVIAESNGAENVPEFLGGWEPLEDYPLRVGEAQGLRMGTDIVIVGGFLPNWSATRRTMMYDTSTASPTWRNAANYPRTQGITHAAFAAKGDDLLYMCGGYLGATPGPHIPDCYVFDKSVGSWGQWRSLPPLPDEGRGGGGMVYIQALDSLLFSLGAKRPDETYDQLDTWMLDLTAWDTTGSAVWVPKADGPFMGNHISFTSATDCNGDAHYYFAGGQTQEDEFNGNIDSHFEYLPDTDEWVQRASLWQGKGHTSSSTIPYSCGYLMIAGSINSGYEEVYVQTAEVTYYDIPTDTWTRIGDFVREANTPVCDVIDDYLYCGTAYQRSMYRRQISIPGATDAPTPAPQPGTPAPSWGAADGALLKLNCGGPAMDGWVSDDSFTSTGASFTRSRFQFNDDSLFMYNTERHDVSTDPLVYNIPSVPDGSYRVDFYFTEVQENGVGQRQMDITIEGELVLDNYDIYDASNGIFDDGVGAMTVPVIESVAVTVSDGNGMQIVLEAVLDDAKVNAIAIYPVLGGPTSSPSDATGGTSPPTVFPTNIPTIAPTQPPVFGEPTSGPTEGTVETSSPTAFPTSSPTSAPTESPTQPPVLGAPTSSPSEAAGDTSPPTTFPTAFPTSVPTESPGLSPAPTPAGIPELVYQINCGASEERFGWETDDSYNLAGRKITRNRFNVNDPDLFVFNTERHDMGTNPIVYEFPDLEDGSYRVDLYFVEAQSANEGPGLRTMNIYMEGNQVLSDFDIYLASGGGTIPLIEPVDVTVSDGDGLRIELEPVVDDAKINGLAIYRTSPGMPTPTASPVVTAAPSVGPGTPVVLYQVNCGGLAEEYGWETDDAFTTDGRKVTRNRAALMGPELFLYNTERHDSGTNPLYYDFDVEDGTYQLDLHFIEVQDPLVGARIMDIWVEDVLELENYDIYGAAGGVVGDNGAADQVPVVESLQVIVSDGNGLQIMLEAVVDDAKINGIVISRL